MGDITKVDGHFGSPWMSPSLRFRGSRRAKLRLIETSVRMGEGGAFRWYNLKYVQSTRGKRTWCILETAREFTVS